MFEALTTLAVPPLAAAPSAQIRSGVGALLWAAMPWVAWVGLTILWVPVALLIFASKRRLRAILLGSCVLASALALWPPYPWGRPAGGIRLTLQIDTDEGLRASRDDAVDTVREQLGRMGVPLDSLSLPGSASFVVRSPEPLRLRDARETLANALAGAWTLAEVDQGSLEGRMSPAAMARARAQVFQEAIAVLGRRLRALGAVASVSPGPGDQVDVELFGVRDVEFAKRVLRTTARLSLQLVEDAAASREALLEPTGQVPETLEVLDGPSDTPGQPTYYLLRKEAMITGREFKSPRVGIDENDRPQINFSLDATTADKFARETGGNIGRQLAIVLDGTVYSAPVIQSKLGAYNRITGRFTAQEARELAMILKAGALPAGVRFIGERPIPPASMLEPMVRAAIVSTLGLVVAVLLVLFGTRLSGAANAGALVVGVGVVLAAMVLVQGVVSPPGVALGPVHLQVAVPAERAGTHPGS